jgi:hypothetical protein
MVKFQQRVKVRPSLGVLLHTTVVHGCGTVELRGSCRIWHNINLGAVFAACHSLGVRSSCLLSILTGLRWCASWVHESDAASNRNATFVGCTVPREDTPSADSGVPSSFVLVVFFVVRFFLVGFLFVVMFIIARVQLLAPCECSRVAQGTRTLTWSSWYSCGACRIVVLIAAFDNWQRARCSTVCTSSCSASASSESSW